MNKISKESAKVARSEKISIKSTWLKEWETPHKSELDISCPSHLCSILTWAGSETVVAKIKEGELENEV